MLSLHPQGCSVLCTHIQIMTVEAQAAQNTHMLSYRKSSGEYCLMSLNGAILLHCLLVFRGFATEWATNRLSQYEIVHLGPELDPGVQFSTTLT